MRRSNVIGVVLGLGLLVAAPAVAAPAEVGAAGTEVRAAADIFLDLGPVCGEGPRCPNR